MSSFFEQCERISCVDRQTEYGDPLPRLDAAGLIGELLRQLMPYNIRPEHAHGIMMLTEKLTRGAVNPNKADTWIDIACYAKFMYDATLKHDERLNTAPKKGIIE
jgi:hypothetical protein